MAYLLRQNKKIVNNLSRQYGRTGAVYRPLNTGSATDVTTGKISRNYDVHIVRRIIPMPFKVAQNFITEATYDRAKNHLEGGFYTTDERTFIIEQKYLDVEINETDSIVMDGKKYEVIKVTYAEQLASSLVDVRALVAVDGYTSDLMSYINAGWTFSKERTAFALDQLLLDVRFDVFNGTVPDDFDILPIAGKNLADALKTAYGLVDVSSTATSTDYKEYGISGGIDHADLETEVAFSPSYPFTNATSYTVIAGDYALTAQEEADLGTAVAKYNATLGRGT